MGRTDEANVGEPGVTPSDIEFFRALIQARGVRLEARGEDAREAIQNPQAYSLIPQACSRTGS